jgi:hypothetical protein
MADEKWDAYPKTVLELQVPGAPRIDLRKPIGDDDRALLRRIGLAGEFAVLTAENPCGENAEDEPTDTDEAAKTRENASRRSRLERELEAARSRFVRVDGVAPDGEYREHGVAVEMPRPDAVALAKRLRQLAIFWFDGRDFWLVGAVEERPPERLPR